MKSKIITKKRSQVCLREKDRKHTDKQLDHSFYEASSFQHKGTISKDIVGSLLINLKDLR